MSNDNPGRFQSVKSRLKLSKDGPRNSSPTSSITSASGDNSATKFSTSTGMFQHLSDIRSLSPASSIASIQEVNTMTDKIKDLESEKLALMIDHNNLIKEFNKRMESHLDEIRGLKESNQNIEQETIELRDLCCFLDDDRNKCRKLAKEWQRFGKHTVTVMRNEVMSYQEKLHSLEKKQSELVKENGELRDLCVYLDHQRTNNTMNGDQLSALNYNLCKECAVLSKENPEESYTNHNAYAAEHIQLLQNKVSQLEREKESIHKLLLLQNKVSQLEREKESIHKLLMFGGKFNREKKRVSFSFPDDDCDSSSTLSEIDRLDYPPSFGSTESFLKSSELNQNAGGILRNGNLSLSLKSSSDKVRSNSNIPSNTYDMNSPSPLSPPPSTVGVPLYKPDDKVDESKQPAEEAASPPSYKDTVSRIEGSTSTIPLQNGACSEKESS